MSDGAVKLERLAQGGDAVGRIDGKTVFVPFGAPGDAVRLGARKEEKNFSRAGIAAVVTPSPDRVEPPCPHFFRPGAAPESVCGGCDWQHLAYPAQARAKRDLLIESFQRLARIAKPAVDETLPCPDPWRYRNKVQIPLVQGPGGRISAGFYAPESHTVVPFEDCLVQTKGQVAVVRATVAWFNANPDGRELLRHLYLRSNARGEMLVALVVKDGSFRGAAAYAEHLAVQEPWVKSVYLNVDTWTGNVVLGPEWRKVAGRPSIDEELMGLKFRLSPGAFFQVNHAMAEVLYAKAAALAEVQAADHVLELYAGVGAMGMHLAPKAKKVWCVEANAGAVRDGIESAALNALSNVHFLVGKCEQVLARPNPRRELEGKPVVVLLDPPRAGCDPGVLKAVMKLKPRRIVYVSCDPATLARDAKYLSTGGYLLRRCAPVDLFPQTSHIESASLFTK